MAEHKDVFVHSFYSHEFKFLVINYIVDKTTKVSCLFINVFSETDAYQISISTFYEHVVFLLPTINPLNTFFNLYVDIPSTHFNLFIDRLLLYVPSNIIIVQLSKAYDLYLKDDNLMFYILSRIHKQTKKKKAAETTLIWEKYSPYLNTLFQIKDFTSQKTWYKLHNCLF